MYLCDKCYLSSVYAWVILKYLSCRKPFRKIELNEPFTPINMFDNLGHINEPLTEGQAFRDRMATVDEQGKRKWVYAHKPPRRKFYNIRTWLSYLYFLLFFGLPFVQINGRPLFLFNIPKARFIIFGKVFWPQDFFIFGLAMVTFIFFIILFTASFGRLFCGWACPQTNFMEMMFRKIEYFILGDGPAQKQLKSSPWTKKNIQGWNQTYCLLPAVLYNR